MNVQLDQEEAVAVAAALRAYVADLRMEISDTERKAMRDGLKHEEQVLAEVAKRLEAAAAGAGAWPYEPAPDVDEDPQPAAR